MACRSDLQGLIIGEHLGRLCMTLRELVTAPPPRLHVRLLLVLICFAALPVPDSGLCLAGERGTVTIGFLEGGEHYAHTGIRQQIRDQLKWLAPDELYIDYDYTEFKTAGWNRDSCRQLAAELAASEKADLVVALGPWAAEDLLAAGFDRPIVVGYRYDPAAEGLISANGRPIAENLTVRVRPRRIQYDLGRINTLLRPDTIGLLYFPSGNERDTVVAKIKAMAGQLGIAVKTAVGQDRNGTFAFFNAYQALDKNIDALYISPLWGFNTTKNKQWYQAVYGDNLPVFSSEGELQAIYGALACGSEEDPAVAARYICWQILKIIEGATPADLQTSFVDNSTLVINEFLAARYGANVPASLSEPAMLVEAPDTDEAERLALAETIDLALTNNPDYQAWLAATDVAAHKASRATSDYLPQLSAGADLGRYDDNAVNSDDRFKNDRFRAGLRLEQILFSLGAVRDIQRAGREKLLAEVDLRLVALQLETAVTLAFVDHLQADQLRLIEKSYRRHTMRAFQVASANAELNPLFVTDAARLEGEWARASQLQEDALRDQKVALIVLNQLMGRPGELEIVATGSPFALGRVSREMAFFEDWFADPARFPSGMNTLHSEAALQSPDLRRSKTLLEIQDFRQKEASARYWPVIGFRATLDHTDQLQESATFSEKNPSWSFGASVTLPLWLGGERFKNRSAMKSRFGELEFRHESARQAVRAGIQTEIETLRARVKNASRLAYRADLAVRNSQQVLDKYVAGKLSLSQLLDAIGERRESARQAVLNQFEYSRSAARLLRKTGWSAYQEGLTPSALLVSRLSTIQ